MTEKKKTYTYEAGKADYDGAGRARNAVSLELDISTDEREQQTIAHETIAGAVRVSIMGAVWNARHSDYKSGGQNAETVRELADQLNDPERVRRICELWNRWHMNDARGACAHQAEEWACTNTTRVEAATAELETAREAYRAADVTDREGRRRAEGALLLAEYAVKDATEHHHTEPEPNGWPIIREKYGEHPYPQRGDACHVCGRNRWDEPTDACPETGYRYGTAWLVEPVPAEIVAELIALFTTTEEPQL
jgi:hypothetical protein